MSDVEDWNADMDAWGLTGDERLHHLRRLSAFHRRLQVRLWASYRHNARMQQWFGLAALVAACVSLLLFIAGGPP